ncbi:hypothetical protein D3C71_2066720 [compost metagenome]
MATVDIGIGHNNNLVIAKTIHVKLFTNANTKGLDHSNNFFICKHLIEACSFGVENFTTKWQDRLSTVITTLFGRTGS